MASRNTTSPVTVLSEDECRVLLAAEDYGRLAVRVGDGVDVFPVNYTVEGDSLYFRSGPGSKMEDITLNPQVAVEIDGQVGGAAWSVVVTGRAARMDTDADIRDSDVQRIAAWHPGEKYNYVRVAIDAISGRRFTVQRTPPRDLRP